jgi:hypothetical protein
LSGKAKGDRAMKVQFIVLSEDIEFPFIDMPIIPRSGELINALGFFADLSDDELAIVSERYLQVKDVIWEMLDDELIVSLHCNLIH